MPPRLRRESPRSALHALSRIENSQQTRYRCAVYHNKENQMETVGGILVLLSLLAVIAAVLGLIKPRWVKVSSRKQAFFGYMIAACVMLVTGASWLPEPKSPPVAASKAEESAAPVLASKPEEPAEQVLASEEPEPKPTEKADPPRVELELNIDDFVSRYNIAQSELGRQLTVNAGDKTDNGDQIIAQLVSQDKNMGIIATANNKTMQLYDVTFIGSGDGSVSSGADVVMNMIALVMAFEDPYMPAEIRREVAEDLGLMEGANIKLKRSFRRAGVVFSLSYIDGMGMFLSAAPATAAKE